MHKRALQFLFSLIVVSLTTWNHWASSQQHVWEWGGLTTPPDNLWTIAALVDAYYGFLAFYLWVGNIAMAAYLLRQLARLAPADSMSTLLSARNC
jgi:hypothetical protein